MQILPPIKELAYAGDRRPLCLAAARNADPGTHLTTEGTRSGHLYVLEAGRLKVTRAGVTLASIDEPGSIVGEMASAARHAAQRHRGRRD